MSYAPIDHQLKHVFEHHGNERTRAATAAAPGTLLGLCMAKLGVGAISSNLRTQVTSPMQKNGPRGPVFIAIDRARKTHPLSHIPR